MSRAHAAIAPGAWRCLAAGSDPAATPEQALAAVGAAASLGLRTLAIDLAARAAHAGWSPDRRLMDHVEALADDAIDPDHLIDRGRSRVPRMRIIGVDAAAALDDWTARARSATAPTYHRALDGNINRRCAAGSWTGLADLRAAAHAPALPPALAQHHAKPIVILGCSPPWLIERVHASTPPGADGYAPPLLVLAESTDSLIEAVALSSADAPWTDARCACFVGPDRDARFAEFLHGRLSLAMPATILRTPSAAPAPAADQAPVVRAIESAARAQVAEHRALAASIARDARGPDAAAWSRRLADPASAPPLRILIPTTRYSTFVQHSARDLAHAAREGGHRVELLIEPEPSSLLTTVSYLRAVRELNPDLIILINYTRADLGNAMPAHIPLITWVQDRMPHLMTPAAGRAIGPHDFVVGHLHEEFFGSLGYPPQRCMFLPIPASQRAFHDGPLDAALARDLACDIAYVSHQSESPRAMHDRLRATLGATPDVRAMIDAIFPIILGACEQAGPALRLRGITESIRTWTDALGRAPDTTLAQSLQAAYVVPMLERASRHTALLWAADIASSRNLTLRLHGNGWGNHPQLARHAAPALDHDEPLRTLYSSATVNLHISAGTNAHQRIAECALSGGLMLRRGPCPDTLLLQRAALRSHPCAIDTTLPREAVLTLTRTDDDRPDPARFWSLFASTPDEPADLTALMLAEDFTIRTRAGIARKWSRLPGMELADIPDYALPFAASTMFRGRDELDARIARAARGASWRAETIAAHRAAALAQSTYTAALHRILAHIAPTLANATEARAA